MSIARLRRPWGPLVFSGVSGVALVACSSHAASTPTTTRPATATITATSGPPPTPAQASRLVTEGCRSLPGLVAAVASAAATYRHDPSGALVALYHGPWYPAVSMGEAGNDPAFVHVATDAKAFDVAALASLKSGDATRVATSVARLTRDCRALGQSTE